MNKNVTILNFSPRNGGNCGRVCDFIAEFHNRTFVCSYNIDVMPCGGCDYECLKPGLKCPTITEQHRKLMDAILASDLVYFVVPNFCGYPCANYFAFNERSVGYFNSDRALMEQYMSVKKRFVAVSNSESDSFRTAMQQQTNGEPNILYLKSGKYKKRSTDGNILDCEEAAEDLRRFLEGNC